MRPLRLLSSPEVRAGFTSGLLLSLAAPPSPLGWLGFIGLVPMVLVMFSPDRIRRGEPVQLRVLVLSYAVVHYVTQLHWLVLLEDAATFRYRWALPGLLVLLAVYLGLFPGVALWASRRLRGRYGVQAIWWFPGLWVCGEWLQGAGELGFPWMRLGMTQLYTRPVLQVAGLLGELGVSLLVAWVNVLVAVSWLAWRGEFPALGRAVLHRYWGPVALLVLLSTTTAYGVHTARDLERDDAAGPALSVAVIQGDVDLNDKWDPARRDSTFVPYTQLTELAGAQGARLSVWPETAVPMDLMRSPRYLQWVQETVQRSNSYLLTGLPERQVTKDGKLLAYNSSLLMDDTGTVRSYYRKMHLLPFGERMPLQWLIPALGKVDMGQAEWAIGPEMTVMEVDGIHFSNLICFESIFPGLSRLAVRRGADFLVNMSNDGWFGDTLAPYQHGLMAAMRAAENRVPLVRVANNGISFFALPSGRIVQQTHLFQRTIRVRTLRPRAHMAPYTRYGDVPLFMVIAVTFVFLWAVGRKRA